MKSAKTRLGFTGLVVCGAAVLVWGAADLYAWATTGQEVLAAYGEAESVLRLVENTFTSALGLPVLTNPRQSCIILYAVKKTALQS